MRTLLILAIPFMLASCANVSPVKFPDPPAQLMQKPAELKTLGPFPSDTALTDDTAGNIPFTEVTKVITDNYKQCNIYRETIFSWQNWVTEQKKIFK